jgi:hypothetical protein
MIFCRYIDNKIDRKDECMSLPDEIKPVFIESLNLEKLDSTDYEMMKENLDIDNKMRYVTKSQNRLENSLYNSVDVKVLMKLEDQGIGDMTITDLLNIMQDNFNEGKSQMYSDTISRKKPVNRGRVEKLVREISTYRSILLHLKGIFAKKRKGSEMRLYANVIEQLLERIDNGEDIINFDKE